MLIVSLVSHGRSFAFNTQKSSKYIEMLGFINEIFYLISFFFCVILWRLGFRLMHFYQEWRKNVRKHEQTNEWARTEGREKKWITASWIDCYFKGIEQENTNVAIILMVIQLSFNSTQLFRRHAGIYTFFDRKKNHQKIQKGKKVSVKTLFSLCSFGSHTHTQSQRTAKESECRCKLEPKKGMIFGPQQAICTHSFILFLEFSA